MERFLEDDKIVSFIPSLLPSHLDSPVRTHILEEIIKSKLLSRGSSVPRRASPGLKNAVRDLKAIIEILPDLESFSIMDASLFGSLNNLSLSPLYTKEFSTQLQSLMNISLRNLELQFADLLESWENSNTDNVAGLGEKYRNLISRKEMFSKHLPSCVTHSYFWYSLLHQAVILSGVSALPSQGDHTSSEYLGNWKNFGQNAGIFYIQIKSVYIIASKNIFCFIDHLGQRFVGMREHLMMFADVFLQRFNIYLSGHLGNAIGYKHYLSPKEALELHIWGDKIMSQLYNKGFDVLSKWEPLCLGTLLKYSNDLTEDPSSFLSTIQNDIISDCSHLYENISDHLLALEITLHKLLKKSKHKISQAFGLFRTWGHPNINPIEGITKLKQIACQKRIPNKQMVDKISCIFKEKFCLTYRMKKGRWPTLDISKLSKTNIIRRAYETNSPLSLVSKFYDRRDWRQVKFCKTFEITDKLNIGNLISDKALSLGIDELIAHIYKYNNVGLATEKAVIVQWLKSALYDPVAFLEDIDKNGFGVFETVFGVCPKERELKIIARFFGLSTLRKRMYIVLTEAMIAEFIIPYFPQITMMDSSLTLSKKFFDKTRDMASRPSGDIPQSINVVINIDFQKWNSYMRKEETFEIFSSMDHLFGLTNCISRTHSMFSESFMYLADGTFIPTPISEDGVPGLKLCNEVWTGHLGGIEGLRQKGWTVFTVCVLIFTLEKLNIKFSLMGQGDNQVLILHFHPTASVEVVRLGINKVINEMDIVLKKIGPPLKKEETWISSSLFVYGKFIILNGCPLSMSQKKICRMFPMSNEGFPTIETAISSIVANCSAACASDISPLVPFLMHSFWNSYVFHESLSISYLGNDQIRIIRDLAFTHYIIAGKEGSEKIKVKIPTSSLKNIKEKNPELLVALNLFPKLLGGYPVGFLIQYFVKGFPDPLTEYLSIIRKLYPRLSVGERKYIANILQPHINPNVNMEYLFANPVGINLKIAITPSDLVKSSVTRFMRSVSWIKNDYVLDFLTLSELDQSDLTSHLSSMTPFNPIVGHAILDATVVGRAKQVVEQLNKTGTLIKLSAKGGEDLLGRIKKGEENYFKCCMNLLHFPGNSTINLQECARITAQQLRIISWKKPDITGVTVPHPYEILIQHQDPSCDNHSMADVGYILAKVTTTTPLLTWMYAETIGDSVPYMGSQTSEKVLSYGKKIAKFSSPLLRSCSQLQTLIGWATERDSNLSHCIRNILEAVTDLEPELLNPPDSSISGSVEHRLSTTALNRGGNVELMFSLGTHLSLSTDTFTAYSKGTANVNLHFQACLSYITSAFSTQKSLGLGSSTSCYHYHQSCINCITSINESKIEVDPADWKNLLISKPNSKFCWTSKNELLKHEYISSPTYPPLPGNYLNVLSASWIQLRCCRLATREAMKRFRQLSIEIGDGKAPGRSGWLFPVAWVWKLNPYVFFVTLYIELFSYFLFRQFDDRLKTQSFQKLLASFLVFLRHIPPQTLGMFSSWFQNSQFMDFISGPPFWVRPPLGSTITRSSCGSCITRLLISISSKLQSHEINMHLFKDWKAFTISGEESLDSSPLLLSILYNIILEDEAIIMRGDIITFLALKSFLGKEETRAELVLCNSIHIIKSRYQELLAYLSHSDIAALIKFLETTKIYHAHETADGVISELRRFDLSCSTIDSSPISLVRLPLGCLAEKIYSEHFEICPRIMSLTPSLLEGIKEVSHANHLLKSEGFPTTASYKLLSILRSMQGEGLDSDYIGCFGDGAGGFTRLILQSSSANVFYNSKIDTAQLFPNALGNYYPPALAGCPMLRKRLFGLKFTYEEANDLTDPLYSTKYIKSVGKKLGMMICDAEGGGWNDGTKALSMLINLCNIAKFSDTNCIIFKTYFSNWSGFLNQIYIISDYFTSTFIHRSLFSSQYSTEVYLVGFNARLSAREYRVESLDTIVISKIMINDCDIALKDKLKGWTNKLVDPVVASYYSRCLARSENPDHVTSLLTSISPRLASCYKKDGDVNSLVTYYFPYHYQIDCMTNTHILKFNNKYNKITKINFITSRFASRLAVGYLMLASQHPRMNYNKLKLIYDEGAIIFYPVCLHYWNFHIQDYKKMRGLPYPKFVLKELLNKHVWKEILTKSAILSNIEILSIKFGGGFDPFYRTSLAINNNKLCFHWGLTPSMFSIDNRIMKSLFGIQEAPSFGTMSLETIMTAWFRDRKTITKSKIWVER